MDFGPIAEDFIFRSTREKVGIARNFFLPASASAQTQRAGSRVPRRFNVNIPWFQREHYEAIKDLLAEEGMPATFDEWLKATEVHVGDMRARGVNVRTVIIDPQEFAAHCASSGVKPGKATLGEFAIIMARRGG